MFYSGDPALDEIRYQREQERKIRILPDEEDPMDDDEIYDELWDLVRCSRLLGRYKDQLFGWLEDARYALQKGDARC